MTQQATQKLIIPALRGRMGDWTYYTTLLKMRDIAARVSVAQEIHESPTLNELIQRVLQEGHSNNIQRYLLTHPQRFFNSLVLGIYGGMPKWFELDIRENHLLNPDELPSYVERSMGLLVLDGTESLFAIDGQHRVVGIKKAVAADETIGDDEVAAIFVAHKNDAAGMERTRRLFTTLNRYAKAVGFGELVALDEDDVVAIVTRRLIEQHPLFKGKIYSSTQKNVPPTDRTNLTSVSALYEVIDIILQIGRPKQWSNFKKIRPDDDSLDQFYVSAVDYWSEMLDAFPELRELRDSHPNDRVAAKYRNENGGHLLFRPVGLVMVARVVRHLMNKESLDLKSAVSRVSHANLWLSDTPWVGLLWDATNMTMMVTGERQTAAMKLLYHACGGDLSKLSQRNSVEKLTKQLAGLLNRNVSEVEIPVYYHPTNNG
jgi:DNA sulfur modification protein DndB